jgi:hypothetical protein
MLRTPWNCTSAVKAKRYYNNIILYSVYCIPWYTAVHAVCGVLYLRCLLLIKFIVFDGIFLAVFRVRYIKKECQQTDYFDVM